MREVWNTCWFVASSLLPDYYSGKYWEVRRAAGVLSSVSARAPLLTLPPFCSHFE